MPRIPLEDNFTDVLAKAQRGLGLTDAALVRQAGVTVSALAAAKSGRIDEPVLRALAGPLRLGGDALVALARQLWYPRHPVFPHGFAMFNTPYADMTVNSYLVWDARTREAAVFDTGASCESMLATLRSERLKLHYIFLTHTHEDHIADLPRLAAETGVPVWASEREPAPHAEAKNFRENAHFHLGELAIKTLYTWGHSPGQTTYYIKGLAWPLAVVGDSLFAASMGGSTTHYREQYRHDRAKILALPQDTVLACGHGPLTTVRQEKEHNPFFSR